MQTGYNLTFCEVYIQNTLRTVHTDNVANTERINRLCAVDPLYNKIFALFCPRIVQIWQAYLSHQPLSFTVLSITLPCLHVPKYLSVWPLRFKVLSVFSDAPLTFCDLAFLIICYVSIKHRLVKR